MIFLFIVLVLKPSVHGEGHPTSANKSNPTLPFPVSDAQLLVHSTLPSPSQSNQTSSSQAQPGQHTYPIPPPDQRNPILPCPVMVPPSPDHQIQPEQQCNPALLSQPPGHQTQPEQQCNPAPLSQPPCHPPPPGHPIQPEQQYNPIPLFQSPSQSNSIPGYQRASQSAPSQRTATPPNPMIQLVVQSPNHTLPPQSLPIPWYCGNGFVALESGSDVPRPHELDNLSLCVLHYFFACGLSHTSTWSQRPNLSTSIHIQCFLNQAAFSLFLLANAVFPRTRPALAFVLDRISFLLIVISAYLASMPMYPPYVAIIMFLVVVIVYIFARFRG